MPWAEIAFLAGVSVWVAGSLYIMARERQYWAMEGRCVRHLNRITLGSLVRMSCDATLLGVTYFVVFV